MFRYLLPLLIVVSVSSMARGQASVSGLAFAEVICTFTASETSPLNFGKFSPELQGGLIIVTPAGERITQGGIIPGGGMSNSGIFHLTGVPDAAFSIELPAGPVILKNQNSGKTMMVDNWVSYPRAGNGNGILVNGQSLVYLGATLNVGSINDNPVGFYSGAFNLTFAYN